MNDLKKRIITNSFWSIITSVVNRIGALIFTVLIARILLPEGYGIYSIVFAITMIFATFSDLGVNNALVKYVSSSMVRDRKKVSSYCSYLLRIKIIFTLISAFSLLILAYPLSFYVFQNAQLFWPLVIASFFIVVFSFDTFYTQLFYPLEKVFFVSMREALNQLFRITFSLTLIYLVFSSSKVAGIFFAYILSSILLIIFSVFYLKKMLPEAFCNSSRKINKKEVKRFVYLLSIAAIASVFFYYFDSAFLGIFVPPAYVGFYKAAFAFVVSISMLFAPSSFVLLPFFAKLKNKRELLFNSIFKYLAVLIMPAIAILLSLGSYFIVFFYGEPYLQASAPLYILAFLIFPIVYSSLFLSFFSAEERPGIFAKITLWATGINVVSNIILIQIFLKFSYLGAVNGAALATLLSWMCYFAFSAKFLKQEFHFSIRYRDLIKPFLVSVLMYLLIILFLGNYSSVGILTCILIALIGFIFYLLVMFLLKGITKSDFLLVRNLMIK